MEGPIVPLVIGRGTDHSPYRFSPSGSGFRRLWEMPREMRTEFFKYAVTDFVTLAFIINNWSQGDWHGYVPMKEIINARDGNGDTLLHVILKTFASSNKAGPFV